MLRIVQVSAVALFNQRGELLTVRKHGTQRFQLPGGKPEAAESPLEAARREVHEEVGVTLPTSSLSFLGHWQGEAANDDADLVSAQVYLAAGTHQAAAHAEIAELHWLDRRHWLDQRHWLKPHHWLSQQSRSDNEAPPLAPLISLFLLPALSALELPPAY